MENKTFNQIWFQMTLNSGFQQTVAGQPGQPQQLHTTAVAAMQQQQIQTAVAQQQQIKTVQQQPQQQQSWMQVCCYAGRLIDC